MQAGQPLFKKPPFQCPTQLKVCLNHKTARCRMNAQGIHETWTPHLYSKQHFLGKHLHSTRDGRMERNMKEPSLQRARQTNASKTYVARPCATAFTLLNTLFVDDADHTRILSKSSTIACFSGGQLSTCCRIVGQLGYTSQIFPASDVKHCDHNTRLHEMMKVKSSTHALRAKMLSSVVGSLSTPGIQPGLMWSQTVNKETILA